MRKKQENKLSMYLAVQKVIRDHLATWTALNGFNSAQTSFTSKIDEISNYRQVQEQNTTGLTENKWLKRQQMVERSLLVSGVIISYASEIEDRELISLVAYTETELLQCADTIARDRCLLIYNKATALGNLLSANGINNTLLTALNNSISEFTALMPKPRTASTSKSNATKKIDAAFRSADKILKERIDLLMLHFKTSKSDFYTMYTKARMIIDHGKRYEPDKGSEETT